MSYMANQKRNKISKNHSLNLALAFELAKINLGSTKENPSVGCVVIKNDTVISNGYTSFNGRPHAEKNALSKKLDYKNALVYVTLEPCSHYGKTPPCANLIKKKKIGSVFFSYYDQDKRSKKKIKDKLLKNKIKVKKINSNISKNFYQSYYLQHSGKIPLVDAKLAFSKDNYTKDKRKKYITNLYSLNRAHYYRSIYNCLISTSKSINEDNSLLNCRIKGLEHKSPDLVIIDRYMKIRKNLKLFKNKGKRKIWLITLRKNISKINFLKKKGVKIIFLNSLSSIKDFKNLFLKLKKMNYTRILIESGVTFLSELINKRFINNVYLFKSDINLGKNGLKKANSIFRKVKVTNEIKVNLLGNKLFIGKIKNV